MRQRHFLIAVETNVEKRSSNAAKLPVDSHEPSVQREKAKERTANRKGPNQRKIMKGRRSNLAQNIFVKMAQTRHARLDEALWMQFKYEREFRKAANAASTARIRKRTAHINERGVEKECDSYETALKSIHSSAETKLWNRNTRQTFHAYATPFQTIKPISISTQLNSSARKSTLHNKTLTTHAAQKFHQYLALLQLLIYINNWASNSTKIDNKFRTNKKFLAHRSDKKPIAKDNTTIELDNTRNSMSHLDKFLWKQLLNSRF